MKIVWFDHGFSGPDAFGKSRSLDLARALADEGHDVSIVNTLQHVPDDRTVGTSGLFRREQKSGSVRLIEFDVLNSGIFPLQLISRLRFFVSLAEIAVFRRADLLVCTSDSRPGLSVTLLARLCRRRPFLIDVRSCQTRIGVKPGRHRFTFYQLGRWLKKWAYTTSSTIISASDDLTRALIKFGFSRHKVQTIANATDRAPFQFAAALPLTKWFKPAPAPGNLVAIYAGRIDVAHGLGGLLDVAELLAERDRTDISFVVVGDGSQRKAVGQAVHARGLETVFLADRIVEDSFPALLKSCDIGLVLGNQNPAVHANLEPANFTAYLAARLPVIANYPGAVAGHIVRNEIGAVLSPGDHVGFADTLERLADNRAELAKLSENASKSEVAGNDPEVQKLAINSVVETALSESQAKRGLLIKRYFDTIIAFALLIVLSPLLAVLALVLRLTRGVPVLGGETVPGLFGRPFRRLRFRTEQDGFLSTNAPTAGLKPGSAWEDVICSTWVTRSPSLWNVLRGDMSLVGPRVIALQDLPNMSGKAFKRLFMRPGLIGPASVGIGAEHDDLEADLWYVQNHSVLLDLEIIGRSLLRWSKSKPAEKRLPGASGNEPETQIDTEIRNEERDGIAYQPVNQTGR